MRPRVITSHNVEVQTASVAIKTLVIEKRQLTLAVFRQIIEEPIFEWTKPSVALTGVGWGHVRYLIDQPASEAINLVWQKGDALRRCIVPKSARYWRRRLPDRAVSWEQRYSTPWTWEGHSEWLETPWGVLGPSQETVSIPSQGPGWDWRVSRDDPFFKEKKEFHEAAEKKFKADLENQKWQYEQDCMNILKALHTQLSAACDKYEALVGPLFDLPQLFIAV